VLALCWLPLPLLLLAYHIVSMAALSALALLAPSLLVPSTHANSPSVAQVFCHITCATDADNVKFTFNAVRQVCILCLPPSHDYLFSPAFLGGELTTARACSVC
jgi:hypothetical protein